MTPEQAATNTYDPFDVTKVWLHADYPLIPVGRIVLNRNPKNYFAEVEQMGFDPAHLIPGIEPSPDRMLQGRLFAYGDTHRYRLGPNSLQLPVNSPFKFHTYTRDGYGTINSQGGAPNYHPNSFRGPVSDKRANALSPAIPLVGVADRTDNAQDDTNYIQARLLWDRVLKPDEKARTIDNIVMMLKLANNVLQHRAINNFSNVDPELGRVLREKLQKIQTHADL